MEHSSLLLSVAFAAMTAVAPRPQSVNMRVSANGNFLSVTESAWRVNANGHRWSDGGFRLSGNAGDQTLSVSASAMGTGNHRSFSLFGSGVNATLRRTGSSWNLWGSVDRENLNLTIDKFGSGYSLWGLSGASLSAHGWADQVTVSGSADPARVSAKTLAVLGAALAALSAEPSAKAAAGPVKAVWRKQYYDGPRQRYGCVTAMGAVRDAVDATNSREGVVRCSGRDGLRADWTALVPLKDGEQTNEPVVDAAWSRAGWQRTTSGGNDCNAYIETLEWMLDRLPVRNVTLNAFCQPGSSHISLNFEYLTAP